MKELKIFSIKGKVKKELLQDKDFIIKGDIITVIKPYKKNEKFKICFKSQKKV